MKTKYYFSLLIVTSLITFSCKDEVEETAETTSGAPKEIIMPRVQPLPMPATTNMTSVPNQPIQNVPQAVPQPVATAKGMNPAHGQPGHRCDIAVGAPLNSPKGVAPLTAPAAPKATYTTTKTPPSTTTSIPLTTTPALLNPGETTTAPGMNPPHGQAGHRCDVAVGAALPK